MPEPVQSPPPSERESRWREILEQLGPSVVRDRFTHRTMIWDPELYGKVNPPPDEFTRAWLADRDGDARRLDARRFSTTVILTLLTLIVALLTLIAAWIAAYPIFCNWLGVTWGC